jgi:large subunit ribosomal protein L19e
MTLATVKRLASDIMKIGVHKVRIDPANIGRAEEALTRNDVRVLIKDGVIYRAPIEGRRSTKKDLKRGHGSRKGTKSARNPRKQEWMQHVRSQRKYLAQLVTDGSLPKEHKRNIYMKVKSGLFKSKKAMTTYLTENNLLKNKK